ncbi:MAG: heavy-metal-associated domain-containing protein [Bacillota bacterium]|nr:heavy-metal-associated domain-containing protein [Bacillota bacterium]
MPGEKTTRTLDVEGMTCMHCAMTVEKALKGVNGVIDAEVDLTHKKATVTYDPAKAQEQQFRDAVARAGYRVV